MAKTSTTRRAMMSAASFGLLLNVVGCGGANRPGGESTQIENLNQQIVKQNEEIENLKRRPQPSVPQPAASENTSKLQICADCRGVGSLKEDCETCGGDGKEDCSHCKGTGKYINNSDGKEHMCGICGTVGFNVCNQCRGVGCKNKQCQACKGSGKVSL